MKNSLWVIVLSLQNSFCFAVRNLKHEKPDHESTEFHKGECIKWEKFAVELAFNRTEDGSVVIIGAHNHHNDFWDHLSKADHLDKVFVEPLIPSQFHDFEKDVKKLPKTTVVNAAVTGVDTEKATIYCTGSKHPHHIVFDKHNSHLKKANEEIPVNIIQTCSIDRDRLYRIHELDTGVSNKKDVDKYITEHDTSTLTIETLLSKHVPSELRMLQVDVEGLDDKVSLYI